MHTGEILGSEPPSEPVDLRLLQLPKALGEWKKIGGRILRDPAMKADDGGAVLLKDYAPRSYWRFENASDIQQDSQGKQPLSRFEGIGAGEVTRWREEADGGMVGGWADSTGEAINATEYKLPFYWESHMGMVPLDSCSKCGCNGTCAGVASAPGLTIEMLIKPNPVCFGDVFTFFSTFPPEPNRTSEARLTAGALVFESQTIDGPGSTAPDLNWSVGSELNGVGVESADYLMDGKWHHFASVKNATTGAQAIWVDGQSPVAFRYAGNTSTFEGKVMRNYNLYFNSAGAAGMTCAGVDEIAMFEEPLPDSLIYQHYKDAFSHRPYSVTDPGTTPPAPAPTEGALDPYEYPPGAEFPTVKGNATQGVSVSAINQLLGFPPPRYVAGHPLRENFNWMAPPYLGGDRQPGVTPSNVTTRSAAIQKELAKRWNYALVLDGHSCCSSLQNETIAYANAHPEIGLTVVIMRIQEHTFLLNRTLPAGCYLQNTNAQNVNCAGEVTTKKILRPTTPELADEVGCPDSVFDHDGEYFRDHVFAKMDQLLTRPITIVNEDGEIFVSLGQVGKCDGDPKVAAAFQKLNATGAAPNWNTYSSLWRLRLTARFRDKFMVEPAFASLKDAHYSEYQVQGSTLYFGNWSITRQINTPWVQANGTTVYYSTEDMYPVKPKWWMSGAGDV